MAKSLMVGNHPADTLHRARNILWMIEELIADQGREELQLSFDAKEGLMALLDWCGQAIDQAKDQILKDQKKRNDAGKNAGKELATLITAKSRKAKRKT